MLSQEELLAYKSKLEAEKRRLLEEIANEAKPEKTDFGSDVDSFDEEADEAEELQNELAVESDLKARVNEIDEALSRIAGGDYGVCSNCGKEIGADVLAVAPESSLCASCKSQEAS